MTKSSNPVVTRYLDKLPPSIAELFLSVREVVLEVAPAAREEIKWKNCLTYVIGEKNAIQTVLGKEKVTLIFHEGAMIKDIHGLLEGDGKTRSYRINDKSFSKTALKNYVRQAVTLSK